MAKLKLFRSRGHVSRAEHGCEFRDVGTSADFSRSAGYGRGFQNAKERFMKYILAIVGAASICAAVPASAEEVGGGVGVRPGVGALVHLFQTIPFLCRDR